MPAPPLGKDFAPLLIPRDAGIMPPIDNCTYSETFWPVDDLPCIVPVESETGQSKGLLQQDTTPSTQTDVQGNGQRRSDRYLVCGIDITDLERMNYRLFYVLCRYYAMRPYVVYYDSDDVEYWRSLLKFFLERTSIVGNDVVHCPVCNKAKYDTVKLRSCGHRLCSSCCLTHMRTASLQHRFARCPVCSSMCNDTSEGAMVQVGSMFPDTFYVSKHVYVWCDVRYLQKEDEAFWYNEVRVFLPNYE